MLSRRSFFAAAAGAVAGAAGVAAAAPVRGPAVMISEMDLAAGPDMTAVWRFTPPQDWANENLFIEVKSSGGSGSSFASRTRYEQMEELFETIRGQELPPWPYPSLPNDATREQYAANLPVIGRDALPADRKLPRACKPGAPARETQEQYRRRVGTKCPGMLE